MSHALAQPAAGAANELLRRALGLGDSDTPFPWQEELLRRFLDGRIDRALDIPTGLGKTAVMAIWLVARALEAAVPRRLVYVVDRRAVVDQATVVAMSLREFVDADPAIKQKLGLHDRSLPISTLRGQYVDNREWLEDPASLAIIVGTVDMVGSRLLFEGYGTSRKMRPYHAGLLGADTLIVLDESHLVPPFEKLIESIADGRDAFGPRGEERRNLVPPLKLLCLSATGRNRAAASFGLQEADLKHAIVKKRLSATKRLELLAIKDSKKLPEALAEQAWTLAADGKQPIRCIVFCNQRKVAEATKKEIEKRARSARVKVATELFVGARRVFERESAANWLAEHGFIAGTQEIPAAPAFVLATSAAEVGVDLDADHMVADLVAWERMVQRLGRVNRRGDGNARVIVVDQPLSSDVKKAREKAPEKRKAKEIKAVDGARRKDAVRKLIEQLLEKNHGDVSPGALLEMKREIKAEEIEDATTPSPLRPALSRALIDAWSMTSLKEHTGRPEIQPWLRGWDNDEQVQTSVVWRTYLPDGTGGPPCLSKELEAFFEAVPPHASEVLEAETREVKDWLIARAEALLSSLPKDESESVEGALLGLDDIAAVLLTTAGDIRRILRLKELSLVGDDKKAKEQLDRDLAGVTLVVDARLGGLSDGLLAAKADEVPRTADDGQPWIFGEAADGGEPIPVVRFRMRVAGPNEPATTDHNWRERLRLATELSEDGDTVRSLIVDKWRHDAVTEDDRSAGHPQLLDEHQDWAEDEARILASRLDLPEEYLEMLAIAARLHDDGKRATRWQRAFNAKDDAVYAKTRGPVNTALLDGYRHEFGSLPLAENDSRLAALPDDLQDLALHLIAAHHGFARPVIRTSGCEDAPPSALEERARAVALRFARLQRRWGAWGLAWWEALLRAADQQASRKNDERDRNNSGLTTEKQ